MKSSVVKRSIVVAGHKTSVSLEDAFWKALKDIADDRDVTLSDLVSSIDSDRHQGNLELEAAELELGHFGIAQFFERRGAGSGANGDGDRREQDGNRGLHCILLCAR